MISTEDTLILISANFLTAFMIDSYSLQLFLSPALPSDKEVDLTYAEITFSLVTASSSDENYFILDVSYL